MYRVSFQNAKSKKHFGQCFHSFQNYQKKKTTVKTFNLFSAIDLCRHSLDFHRQFCDANEKRSTLFLLKFLTHKEIAFEHWIHYLVGAECAMCIIIPLKVIISIFVCSNKFITRWLNLRYCACAECECQRKRKYGNVRLASVTSTCSAECQVGVNRHINESNSHKMWRHIRGERMQVVHLYNQDISSAYIKWNEWRKLSRSRILSPSLACVQRSSSSYKYADKLWQAKQILNIFLSRKLCSYFSAWRKR